MLFSRIRCHFCGSKQPHTKSVTEFQCSVCEAVNYLDGKGNILDTPASAATSQHRPVRSRSRPPTRPLPAALEHQQKPAFCRLCTQNQHLYNETLSNYLPDESHPEYRKFEAAIPAYKAELERRYPLVCKECAPAAQFKINRSDYYGMSQNASKLVSATRARREGRSASRTRDSWDKKGMRMFLNLVSLALYLSLATQVVYHAFGILNLTLGARSRENELADATEPVFATSPSACVQQSLNLRFSSSCHQVFGTLIPRTLALAACFLWHNPGLKAWYHHTRRIEAVHGQLNYFYMQLIMLVTRSWAWHTLATPSASLHLDKEQLIAIHGFTILFLLLTQAVANRSISTEKWTIKGKIMPKPDELDVLSAFAGPSAETYTPRASEKDPWRYLRSPDTGPLDISNFAAKLPKQATSARTSNPTQQPSPDLSDDEDGYDRMETDDRPVMRSSQRFTRPDLQPRQIYNHSRAYQNPQPGIGFGTMTDQVFEMDLQMREENKRRNQEHEALLRSQRAPPKAPSPFYGTLPPAPMSMERRLRNPTTRPADPPPPIPLSQQRDFMAQMRAGVKPVQFPEKGSTLELRQGKWVLPSDIRETGLEDRFSNTFNLADPAPPAQNGGRSGFFGFFAG